MHAHVYKHKKEKAAYQIYFCRAVLCGGGTTISTIHTILDV